MLNLFKPCIQGLGGWILAWSLSFFVVGWGFLFGVFWEGGWFGEVCLVSPPPHPHPRERWVQTSDAKHSSNWWSVKVILFTGNKLQGFCMEEFFQNYLKILILKHFQYIHFQVSHKHS